MTNITPSPLSKLFATGDCRMVELLGRTIRGRGKMISIKLRRRRVLSVLLPWVAVMGMSTMQVMAAERYSPDDLLSMNIEDLMNGTNYYIVVTAYNSYGESGYSNEIVVAPINYANVPVLVEGNAGDGEITLSWIQVIEATGYNVKYGTSSGNYSTTIDVGDVTNHTVSGLTNETPYYFAVSAYNALGESDNSNEKQATPTSSDPIRPGP